MFITKNCQAHTKQSSKVNGWTLLNFIISNFYSTTNFISYIWYFSKDPCWKTKWLTKIQALKCRQRTTYIMHELAIVSKPQPTITGLVNTIIIKLRLVFGLAVGKLIHRPASLMAVPGLNTPLRSWLHLPATADPKRRWWWLQGLGSCHLLGRWGLSSWLLASALVSLGIWGMN